MCAENGTDVRVATAPRLGFLAALRAVDYARDHKGKRAHLYAVRVEFRGFDATVTAIDGGRYAMASIKGSRVTGDGALEFTMPADAIPSVMGCLLATEGEFVTVHKAGARVTVGMDDGRVSFNDHDAESGPGHFEFPDCRRFLARDYGSMVFLNSTVVAALRKAIKPTRKRGPGTVYLGERLDGAGIKVSSFWIPPADGEPAHDDRHGEMGLAIGNGPLVGLNARYLYEALAQVRGHAWLCFNGEMDPVEVWAKGRMGLIMPLRLGR